MASAIIEIFITRKGKIQVELTEPINGKLSGVIKKQIIVGGKRWQEGELKEHEDRIYRKVRELLTSLHIQCEEHIAN